MPPTTLTDQERPELHRYEYDDGVTAVADLGVPEDAVTVDFVGETAIVVVDHDTLHTQYEVELPGADAHTFMKNGVLTIEVRQ